MYCRCCPQIRDWVSVEVDMLRTQAVAVGDVDEILQQLDKQKVSANTTYTCIAGVLVSCLRGTGRSISEYYEQIEILQRTDRRLLDAQSMQ